MADSSPRGMRRPALLLFVLGVILVWSWWLGGYEFEFLSDSAQRSAAILRMGEFLSAFASPDLGGEYLATCALLAIDTLAIAILATAMAMIAGFLLALASSRNALLCEPFGRAMPFCRLRRELARLLQDVLRGVPDFAWAVLLIPFVGLGTSAGILALFINVTGILARVYSELFDALPASQLEPFRAAGIGRLRSVLYGILPAVRGPLLSFTLLRWECSVRNAAVIGAVGGGGLGSEVIQRLGYGEYDKVLTVLIFLLVLTLGSDQISRLVRACFGEGGTRALHWDLRQARQRILWLFAGIALVIAASLIWVLPDLGSGHRSSWFDRGAEALRLFGDLLRPDPAYLGQGLQASGVTLSMAVLGTFIGVVGAGLLAPLASRSLSGSLALVGMATRFLATLSRTIPEVFWALLLVSFFRHGTLPGMLALALHSGGLLLRLFAESADGVPARSLEVVHALSGSRAKTYAYGVLPRVAPHWIANAFFQLEANVRTGIVLGIVGAAGLGFQFKYAFSWFHYREAGTYLLLMVSFALLLDRLSRSLGFARARLG